MRWLCIDVWFLFPIFNRVFVASSMTIAFTTLLHSNVRVFCSYSCCSHVSSFRDYCIIQWNAQLTHFFACCNHADLDNAAVACPLVLGPEPAPCSAFSECYCSMARNNVRLQQAQHIHKKQQASNKSDKQWNHKSNSIICQDSLLFHLCRDSLHDIIYA